MRDLLAALGWKKRHFLISSFLLLVWLLVVVLSGAGWQVFGLKWNFSNPGAFGDSFGPLNTLMALLAALGAIAAYKSQADELKRIKIRQEELDEISSSERLRSINRENEIDLRAAKVSFENSFFKLLESLRSLVSSIDVKKREGVVVAHDAFEEIVKKIENAMLLNDGSISEAWEHVYKSNLNDLNHYFRFLYHVILYIHYSEIENKYFYVRLVRAMLSEAELILIALNCEYGHGQEKFKPLVLDYALLHNLSESAIATWKLNDCYEREAFFHSEENGAISI